MNFMVHWLNNKEMTYTEEMERLVAEMDRLEQQQHDDADHGQSRDAAHHGQSRDAAHHGQSRDAARHGQSRDAAQHGQFRDAANTVNSVPVEFNHVTIHSVTMSNGDMVIMMVDCSTGSRLEFILVWPCDEVSFIATEGWIGECLAPCLACRSPEMEISIASSLCMLPPGEFEI